MNGQPQDDKQGTGEENGAEERRIRMIFFFLREGPRRSGGAPAGLRARIWSDEFFKFDGRLFFFF